MVQYPISHVLLITAFSMAVLLLVLAALAFMVNWMITILPERIASPEADSAESRPPVAIPDPEGLDPIAAAVGVAIARSRIEREQSRKRGEPKRTGFNPWRDLPRSGTTGYPDRGWRPR